MPPTLRTLIRSTLVAFACTPILGAAQYNELVDIDVRGVIGARGSGDSMVSADGNRVAFFSQSDFRAGGADGNIFVRDRMAGTLQWVNSRSDGTSGGTRPSKQFAISADGRSVAFQSACRNLVDQDNNDVEDIFVKDLVSGETTRVSVNTLGAEANQPCQDPAISADGRYVAFSSRADNLVANETNLNSDVFVHDRLLGTTTRVSVNSAGAPARGSSSLPSISADGRFIAFTSTAFNLHPRDHNGTADVFLHDQLTGTTELVSLSLTGTAGSDRSEHPAISADGSSIAFATRATDLVVNTTSSNETIVVADRRTRQITRAHRNDAGAPGDHRTEGRPALSADGRYVSFASSASNLSQRDTQGKRKVYRYDRFREHVTLVGGPVGTGFFSGDDSSSSLSADGSVVGFSSDERHLIAGMTLNQYQHIYVREMGNGSPINTAILTGPFQASPGDPISLSWCAAPPNAQYYLMMSPDLQAHRFFGHLFELGAPRTVVDLGVIAAGGHGNWTHRSIPASLSGNFVHFELGFRTSTGKLGDSIAHSLFVR